MHVFVTWLWIASLVLVVLERFSAAMIHAVQSGFANDALRALAGQAVSAIPEFLFLHCIWRIRQTLGAFSRGELFSAALTRMLDGVGVTLAIAAAARLMIVPGACRLLGFDVGHWIAFDAASLTLLALGLALKAIAGVLRQASVIQSELDEIF